MESPPKSQAPNYLLFILLLSKQQLVKDPSSSSSSSFIIIIMGRWIKPEVYPLMAAMTFVTSLCVFQLTRNLFLNPDVRINKAHRSSAVLQNHEEGEKYADHKFRKFLRTKSPEVMPAINHFFSDQSSSDHN